MWVDHQSVITQRMRRRLQSMWKRMRRRPWFRLCVVFSIQSVASSPRIHKSLNMDVKSISIIHPKRWDSSSARIWPGAMRLNALMTFRPHHSRSLATSALVSCSFGLAE